jgi:hypothetical protein
MIAAGRPEAEVDAIFERFRQAKIEEEKAWAEQAKEDASEPDEDEDDGDDEKPGSENSQSDDNRCRKRLDNHY